MPRLEVGEEGGSHPRRDLEVGEGVTQIGQTTGITKTENHQDAVIETHAGQVAAAKALAVVAMVDLEVVVHIIGLAAVLAGSVGDRSGNRWHSMRFISA